jgi:hypothetical protein
VRGAVKSRTQPRQPRTSFIPTCVGRLRLRCSECDEHLFHPHVRGAVPPKSARSPQGLVSSPRAWGGWEAVPPALVLMEFHPHVRGAVTNPNVPEPELIRFIPTCVGRFRLVVVGSPRGKVSSPRAWGGCNLAQLRHRQTEFHPHVRGAVPWRPSDTPSSFGFIPTCVGRLNDKRGGLSAYCVSSPRAWGGYNNRLLFWRKFRFIPTCVGRFQQVTEVSAAIEFHPHVRGAVDPGRSQSPVGGVSSPRAWGGSHQGSNGKHLQGFIPTCVGRLPTRWNTRQWSCVSSPRAWGGCWRGDSGTPRVCFIPTCVGRFYCQWGPRCPGDVSSPRAWGGLALTTASGGLPSFIPTCVGRFLRALHAPARFGVSSPRAWGGCDSDRSGTGSATFHPHVRGAVGLSNCQRAPGIVSSPRAWGGFAVAEQYVEGSVFHPHVRGAVTRATCSAQGTWRFIPTCVGRLPTARCTIGSSRFHPHVRGAVAILLSFSPTFSMNVKSGWQRLARNTWFRAPKTVKNALNPVETRARRLYRIPASPT